MVVVVYYPTPSKDSGREGTPQRPKNRATSQGLNQRSIMLEVESEIAHRRSSDEEQSNRR